MRNHQIKALLYSSLLILFGCNPSPETPEKPWNSAEVKMSSTLKRSLLLSLKDSLVIGMINQNPDTTSLSFFHIIDLNSDGMDDLIYNGFGGASDEFMMVFLKDSTGWQKVIHDYGHIQQLQIGPTGQIQLFKKEAVGESGGDSSVTFKWTESTITRSAQPKK